MDSTSAWPLGLLQDHQGGGQSQPSAGARVKNRPDQGKCQENWKRRGQNQGRPKGSLGTGPWEPGGRPSKEALQSECGRPAPRAGAGRTRRRRERSVSGALVKRAPGIPILHFPAVLELRGFLGAPLCLPPASSRGSSDGPALQRQTLAGLTGPSQRRGPSHACPQHRRAIARGDPP